MKPIYRSAAAVLSLLLAGCASQQAEAERKLTEAQQKLDEATRKLEEMEKTAGKSAAAALEQARTEVKQKAESVRTTAKNLATTAGDKGAAVVAAAERKAVEAAKKAVPPKVHTLPAGTEIVVRTITKISTKTAAPGTAFEASLAEPIEHDGFVIAKRGADVGGVVTDSDSGGRVKGRASLSLALRSIVLADGSTAEISTDKEFRAAGSSVKKDTMKVGIASGIGAAIGAIAGGGKGAAIGAGVGGAGGTGVVLATKGDAAELPAETKLTFKLTAPLAVTEPRQ